MDTSSDLSDLSSVLSTLSRSPTPPTFYPSPEPSQTRDSSIASKRDGSDRKRSPDREDEERPKKKRKSAEVKPRTTVHLDLRSPPQCPNDDQSEQLALLLKVLRKRRKIVVVAGAGISTSAGGESVSIELYSTSTNISTVPDFRSSNGLFNTLKSDNKLKASGKQLFDASVYQTDASTSSFHDMVRTLSGVVSKARPTEFHEMLATLADEGRLLRLYTQNVDGIDTSLPPLQTSVPLDAKGPWPRTIQLHGSLEKMVCSKCNALSAFDPEKFSGPTPSACPDCVKIDEIRTDHAGKRSHGIGKLRPRMVLYNEHNPDADAIGRVMSADLRSRPDAVIVVGTSMEIPGVKRFVREVCGVVRDRRDGVAIWINRGPPPIAREFENCWDLVVAGDCDSVATQAGMRRWNEEAPRGDRVTDSEAEAVKQNQAKVSVLIKSSSKSKQKPRTKSPDLPLTPAASPKQNPADPPRQKIMIKLQLPKSTTTSTASSRSSSKAPSKKKKKDPSTSKPASKKPATTTTTKPPKAKQPPKPLTGIFKVTKPQISLPPQKQSKQPPPKQQPPPLPPISTHPYTHRVLPPLILSPDAVLFPALNNHNNNTNSPFYPQQAEKGEEQIKAQIVEAKGNRNEKGRLKRLSEEIVSPVGGAPRDMGRLLN